MDHFEFKSAFVKLRFHKLLHGDAVEFQVFTVYFILVIIKVTTSLIAFKLSMVAHCMISTTLLPAASRLTPSRQTSHHPFSFLEPFLVTNVPPRHAQLRETRVWCCSCQGLSPAAAVRTWACSQGIVLSFCNQRDIFIFSIYFYLDIPLILYWEKKYSQEKRKEYCCYSKLPDTWIQQVKDSTVGKK